MIDLAWPPDIGERRVHDPGVLGRQREIQPAASIRSDEHRDFNCVESDAVVDGERDRGHGSPHSVAGKQLCLDSLSGVSVATPRLVVENHGRYGGLNRALMRSGIAVSPTTSFAQWLDPALA